jgi:hypothetical protein
MLKAKAREIKMEAPTHKAEAIKQDEAVKFDEVYRKEWEEIQERRVTQLYISRTKDSPEKDCKPEALTGLALSGGGIRSATFCLGLLQGMHKLRLLRIFDYLSTVSGGGYVGGWWSAWLSRQQMTSSIEEEWIEPDFALLCPEDIKNPSNLAIKLRGSGDQVSVNLRESFSPETKQLLARYRDQGAPSSALIDALVKELNLAIISKTLSTLLKDKEPEENLEDVHNKSIEELRFEEHSIWSNRLLLEEAYPFEIRGLFPPREKIEPERSKVGAQSFGQKEGESSRNAWKDPIHHLRLYANYLTPRRGLLSADTWRAVSTITGNLIMTWLIMLPLLTAVMLLGQLYFLLHPSIGDRLFGGNIAAGDLLGAMIPPLAAILGWLVLMSIAWLLCNRDGSTITDLIMQGACLIGVLALVLSGVTVFTGKSLFHLLEAVVNTSARLWILIGWGLVSVVLLCVACLQPDVPGPPTEDHGTSARWKSELRRNKISHMQTWLLVLFVMLALVLLLSGFSHLIIDYLSNFKGLNISLTWVPVVSAIAGSIFTAMKATPSGGGDKLEARQPSLISRFVLAVTPGLVVCVLTVTVAWIGYHLLESIWKNGNIDPFLTVAALYGIALCFALAIYEMTWPDKFKLSLALLAFGCLLTVNVSWGAHALTKYIWSQGLSTGLLLFLISMASGISVSFVAFTRIAVKGKWKRFLATNPLLKKFHQSRPSLLWASLVIIVLILFGLGVVLSLFYEKGKAYVVNPTAIALGLGALAGSLILFRLAVVRRKDEEHYFELKWFRGKAIGQKPEALWLLASVCLALPIAVSSWVQAILEHNKATYTFQDTLPLIFFPLVIALLPSSLILFRTLAIQIKESSDASNEKQNILDWAISKIPKAETRKHAVLRMLAGFGIGGAIIAGYAFKKLTGGSLASLDSVGGSVSLILIGLAIAFAAIVAIFKLAVFQIPVRRVSKPSVSRRKRPRASRLRKPGFIWLLAGTCIALAIWVGYLTSVWSQHIQKNPIGLSLASVALPGMAACFTLTAFEMWWGQSDNRRSVWLMAVAYLGLSMLFVIGWIMTSESWLSPFSNNQWEAYIKPLRIVFGLLAAALVWVVALGWMVDPNTVSMHQFYKARLVRAYLGASNPRRLKEHKEIADAVAGDDVPLSALKNCQRGAPYHLINTTLNLVAGRDLSTAQRSASSFILSKNYCGSLRTNYRPTDSYMNGRLSLGTAVAASGAAVSPSMGSKKPTAAMAMLLTLLNVRLGYWSPTPSREHWKMSQPRLWPFYLLREFLSQTNDLSSYCYLTDGGHFDNTGLYSLVERGCRYIVLVDCGADPQPSCFQDLGDAIRRCRIDFGAEVDLKLDHLIENKCQSATQYFAVGEIKYSRKHAEALHWKIEGRENDKEEEAALTGIIIYFKPTILGKETADVRQYAIENKYFPQQSTANQWFGEAQFESYRRLGQSYAKEAFEKLEAIKRINRRIRLSSKDVEAVFVEIFNRYTPKSDQPEEECIIEQLHQ